MKKTIMLLTLAFSMSIVACNKGGDDCSYEKYGSATILNAPDSLKKNEVFPLTLDFLVESSCGELNTVEAKLTDNTLEAKLIIEYDNCECEDVYETRTTSYPIQFSDTGHYQLHVWVAENEFDIYNLTVYE